jgi:hypothetical protein
MPTERLFRLSRRVRSDVQEGREHTSFTSFRRRVPLFLSNFNGRYDNAGRAQALIVIEILKNTKF